VWVRCVVSTANTTANNNHAEPSEEAAAAAAAAFAAAAAAAVAGCRVPAHQAPGVTFGTSLQDQARGAPPHLSAAAAIETQHAMVAAAAAAAAAAATAAATAAAAAAGATGGGLSAHQPPRPQPTNGRVRLDSTVKENSNGMTVSQDTGRLLDGADALFALMGQSGNDLVAAADMRTASAGVTASSVGTVRVSPSSGVVAVRPAMPPQML
jgi:hypothetical protein